MKQLVLFLALGILLIGNNFLSPIVLAETLEEEKKEQLLDSSEKIIEQLKLKVRNLEAYENWNKSKKLRERILNITKQIYGKNHVNTAIELNELAHLYNKTGEYEKAKSYYKKSLEINKKINYETVFCS